MKAILTAIGGWILILFVLSVLYLVAPALLLFAVIAFVVLGALSIGQKECPNCKNRVHGKATVCSYCQSQLTNTTNP